MLSCLNMCLLMATLDDTKVVKQARAAAQARSSHALQHGPSTIPSHSSADATASSDTATQSGTAARSDTSPPSASQPQPNRSPSEPDKQQRRPPQRRTKRSSRSQRSSWRARLLEHLARLRSSCGRLRERYLCTGSHIMDAVLAFATVYLFYLAAPAIITQVHSQFTTAVSLLHKARSGPYAALLWATSVPSYLADVYTSLPTFPKAVSLVRDAVASVTLQDVANVAARGLGWCASLLGGGLLAGGRGALWFVFWLGRTIWKILMSRSLWGIACTLAYLLNCETVRLIHPSACAPLKFAPMYSVAFTWRFVQVGQ